MGPKRFFWGVVSTVFLLLFSTTYASATISVSPTEINLTVEVPPGASTATYNYTIGVSTDDNNTDTKYSASADQGWMSIDKPTGDIPGSFTLTITVDNNLLPNGGTTTGTVTVTSNGGSSATVTVNLTIIRIIADKLTVTPNEITLHFTMANLQPQSFTAYLSNANIDRNDDFKWSAEVSAPWLKVAPVEGTGASSIQVTVDPSTLVAGTYCNIPGSTDKPCNYDAGIITFRSNLPTDKAEDAITTLKVNLVIEKPHELAVFPSYLFWTMELSEDGTLDDFSPQIIHVYAGAQGFSISYDVPWITTEFLNRPNNVDPHTLASDQSEGIFQVTPIKEIFQSYGPGRYEGKITVWDRGTGFYREVPITVEIRNLGDPISLPVNPPRYLQMVPGFVFVNATDAHWLHMLLHVDDVHIYPSQSECEAAGGTWVDPFTGGQLVGYGVPYCTKSEKVYVLLSAPQVQPGKVYAVTPTVPGGFMLVYENGALKATSDPFYAVGPIPVSDFGPMQLVGLKGQLFISVRVGSSLSSTREVQQIQVNINNLEGYWLVSENYQGQVYTYGSNKILHLWLAQDALSYVGTWGTTPVVASLGDGKTLLYRIEFVEQGIIYEYEVTYLNASEMRGRWRFKYGGDYSQWETFQATRLSSPLGTNPFL